MANEIQYRNHTAYNNGISAENNIKLLDITPFQHEDLSSGVNKLGKMLVAQSFCEPVAVCNSNNPQNGAYVANCSNYPDFALSYQDAQQNTQYLIGLKIRVIFTYGITYGSVSGGTYPTLNINGSGAIPMLAQGKTMASGAASAGQSIEFTIIPHGNGVAFDADSNVRESTSDYTIYTDGSKTYTTNYLEPTQILLSNNTSSSKIFLLGKLQTNTDGRAGCCFDITYRRVDTVGRVLGVFRADNLSNQYLCLTPNYIPITMDLYVITNNREYNIYCEVAGYTPEIKITLSSLLNFVKNVQEVSSKTGTRIPYTALKLDSIAKNN